MKNLNKNFDSELEDLNEIEFNLKLIKSNFCSETGEEDKPHSLEIESFSPAIKKPRLSFKGNTIKIL